MSNDTEAARRQASLNHDNNPQTPMATEQSIPSYTVREAYNGQLAHERSKQNGNG
jgi:hypothetical protein